MLYCEFSEAENLSEDPAFTDFEFTKINCEGSLDYSTNTLPAFIEYIEDTGESGNNFFLEKNITYGDFLIIAFLILIFLGFTTMSIRDFAKNRKLERL
ncbi:MAG: hypothetical protein PHO28_03935 [Candidatus Pacebacteria bacterium]|nr:hypothetical protein [Candidatus Paceibacterota bacterium]